MTANMTIDATIDTFNILEIRNNQKYRAMENTETVKVWDIPKYIATKVDYEHDGITTDLKLHSQDLPIWGALCENDYNEAEKRINDFIIDTEEYEVYLWCDSSGFSYWSEQQEEPNYIQATVSFKGEELPKYKLEQLINDLEHADYEAYNIAECYPNPH